MASKLYDQHTLKGSGAAVYLYLYLLSSCHDILALWKYAESWHLRVLICKIPKQQRTLKTFLALSQLRLAR